MPTDLHKPLYIQIQEYLAEQILSGFLQPETRIPSERELSQELEVSRMTVRRAITELVNEGLLERKHGAGTFTSKPKVTFDTSEFISYTKAIQSRGMAVTRQLLEFNEVPASQRLAEKLEVEIGHPLYHIVLLYLANRIPIILERTFLSCERCPGIQEYNLEKTALHDLLTKGLGMDLACIDQHVEAAVANESVAKQMRVADGFPLLMVTSIVYRSEDELAVQFSQDLLRGDYVRVHTSMRLSSRIEGQSRAEA